MDFRSLKKFLSLELIYALITIVFLVNLNGLKTVLNANQFNNSFELLKYNNWSPIGYFFITFVLVLVGIVLIIKRTKYIRNFDIELKEIVISILMCILVFVFIILLIVFINNPIFRAILVATGCIIGAGYLFGKN